MGCAAAGGAGVACEFFANCVTAGRAFFDFRGPGLENLIGSYVFKDYIPNPTFDFALGMSHL